MFDKRQEYRNTINIQGDADLMASRGVVVREKFQRRIFFTP